MIQVKTKKHWAEGNKFYILFKCQKKFQRQQIDEISLLAFPIENL